MRTQIGTSPTIPVVTKKANARVALFDVPRHSAGLLTECFQQFGIEPHQMSARDHERLHREKFDACVLPLQGSIGGIIELARNSASNSRLVIYGLGGSTQDALRYSKYCINAIFQEPLEKSAATKLVRATRPLVLHEFRRYARVPLITDVSVVAGDATRIVVSSQDISSGGMSLKGTSVLEPGIPVEVSFAMLTLPRIWMRGHVTWKRPDKTVGIRFDPNDERKRRLKEWLAGYLESS
jgi:hypothetical protein